MVAVAVAVAQTAFARGVNRRGFGVRMVCESLRVRPSINMLMASALLRFGLSNLNGNLGADDVISVD